MSQNPKDTDQTPPQLPSAWIGIIFAVMTIFLVLSVFSYKYENNVETISYSELKTMILNGDVSSAVLEEHSITVVTSDKNIPNAKTYRAIIPVQDDSTLLPMLEDQKIKIAARPPKGSSILLTILPWVFILGFYLWLQRRMMGGLSGPLGRDNLGNLFKGRFSKPTEQKQRITFKDVAGQEQAKREVSELVDFLREPDRFSRVGATVPHGVLLMGPPGTGKTLLAKALAGEADVPFFSTTGSEFIEVFVGVGASRVRKMFEAARKVAPSIIFIDELDSIGRTRGTGLGGGNDEREQTLNQILAELDGFDRREAVVVLAATNRPDVLDPALLRPGRFDRHVTLNLPDKKARRAILDIHAKGLPLSNNNDLDVVAAGTTGFSGADLRNLLNEAAIGAARRRAEKILKSDLDEARDKVMMGTVRTLAIRPDEHKRLAVHEAGHTAAAYYTPEADPLFKVTIIPRGRSLGGTHMLNTEERHTLSEDFLHSQLVTLLAGRAAEKLIIGTVSSGADDDIKRATELARSMVSRWGMDKKIGPINLRDSEDHPFLGQSIAQPRNHADETAARVDQAVITMLQNAETKAKKILSDNKPGLERLIEKLEEEEILDIDSIRECLGSVDNVLPLPFKRGKKKTPPALK